MWLQLRRAAPCQAGPTHGLRAGRMPMQRVEVADSFLANSKHELRDE